MKLKMKLKNKISCKLIKYKKKLVILNKINLIKFQFN